MSEDLLGSLVSGGVGAVVGGLLSFLGTLVSLRSADKARDDERTLAKQIRAEERTEAAKVRAEERDAQRANEIAAAGRAAAEDVLAELAALRAHFGAQSRSDSGTFDYNEDLTRRITYKARLVRDEDLQEAIQLSITVINETWVTDKAGDLEGPGYAAQIETLESAMNIVAGYLRGQAVDAVHLRGLREIKSAIDETYADMFE